MHTPGIGGTTRVICIIGQPIRQVRSPALLNALLARQGADAVMVPVELAAAAVPGFVAVQRGWRNSPGFVVTVPHKRAVAGLVDALSPRAARLAAVNLVVRDAATGRLTGDHLDGIGCVGAMRAQGVDPRGRRALVVGVGGAGSAIADALGEAGVARLALRDLDAARLAAVAAMLRGAFPAVQVEATESGAGLGNYDVVVNATPVGMGGDDGLPVAAAEIATLRPGMHVVEVVTEPAETAWLAAARARGCSVQAGEAMVAAQIEAFVGALGLVGRGRTRAGLEIRL